MRSERIRLRSVTPTVYELKRKYEGDKISSEEFLREGKPLDYAVYLSVDDANQAYRQYRKLKASGELKSEGDLAKLVASWRAKSMSGKGGRVFYFLIDDEEKRAKRYNSEVIGEYTIVNKKDVSGNGSDKKGSGKKVAKAQPLHETSDVPIVGEDDLLQIPGEEPKDDGVELDFLEKP